MVARARNNTPMLLFIGVVFAIAHSQVPDLEFIRENPPQLSLNEQFDSLAARYKTFLIISKESAPSENAQIRLDKNTTKDKYVYASGKQSIVDDACSRLFGTNFKVADRTQLSNVLQEKLFDLAGLSDADLVELKKIRSVDAIVVCNVNYARQSLRYVTTPQGAWQFCYVPETSVTLRVISTANASVIFTNTLSMNELQVLPAPKFVNACPPDDIDKLLDFTIILAGLHFVHPLKAAPYYYDIFFGEGSQQLIAFYRDYLLINPTAIGTKGTLGWTYFLAGDMPKFIETTTQAYRSIPDTAFHQYAFIVMNYGHARLCQNEVDSAVWYYRKSLELGKSMGTISALKADFNLIARTKSLQANVRLAYKEVFDEEFVVPAPPLPPAAVVKAKPNPIPRPPFQVFIDQEPGYQYRSMKTEVTDQSEFDDDREIREYESRGHRMGASGVIFRALPGRVMGAFQSYQRYQVLYIEPAN